MKKYVSGLLFNKEGKFLILRRSYTAPWMPNHWNLPAGHIEAGEEPHVSLAREILEELNLSIPSYDYWLRKKVESPGCVEYYFNVPLRDEDIMMIALNFENDGMAWVDPATMLDYKLVPDLTERIYTILVEPNVSIADPTILKALTELITAADPSLDVLVKALAEKEDSKYEFVVKDHKILGYKQVLAKPDKKVLKEEPVTGVAHPLESSVSFKRKNGELLTGKVVKHGNEHKQYGKMLHITGEDGKQYTRFAHNAKQHGASDKDDKKPNIHPIGAKVTLKNKAGKRVNGTVVKHGEKHKEKGQILHVETDHGIYKRYHTNASRVETGEKSS